MYCRSNSRFRPCFRGRADLTFYQINLAPICTIRGARNLVISPNDVEVLFVLPKPFGLGWLVTLKNSPRS